MLITLALILIMAAMLGGRGSRSRQQRDLNECEKNLQRIYSAMTIYTIDNKDRYPVATNAQTSEQAVSLLVPRSTTVTAMFTCPGSKDSALAEGEPFADEQISYAYYMGWKKNDPAGAPLLTDRQINTQSKTNGARLFSGDGKGPGANHHKYGGNILLLSGEVKRSGTNASIALHIPTNIVLLNPRQ
jgi:hypothetical protein